MTWVDLAGRVGRVKVQSNGHHVVDGLSWRLAAENEKGVVRLLEAFFTQKCFIGKFAETIHSWGTNRILASKIVANLSVLDTKEHVGCSWGMVPDIQ